jgi:hypothetical protein
MWSLSNEMCWQIGNVVNCLGSDREYPGYQPYDKRSKVTVGLDMDIGSQGRDEE